MKKLLLAAALACSSWLAHAVDMPISAQDALAKVQQADSPVLFIDVRDPVEIMFVGFTDAVHANIPFMLVDRTRWNADKGVFVVERNPAFIDQVRAALRARGLGDDAEIITLCRSGSDRGEPSAQLLRERGFPNARFVVNGFQGDARKEGPQKGMRTFNGWQNSGLPWSAKLDPAKIHRVDLH